MTIVPFSTPHLDKFTSFAQVNLICTSCITMNIVLWSTPHLYKFDLNCTHCIANEYCTVIHPSFVQVWPHLHKVHNYAVFHPSFVQVRPHLHRLPNIWTLYCVPPLICTSCITVLFHPSSSQVRPHLHKLHNKWLLYHFPPLICTSSTSFAQGA